MENRGTGNGDAGKRECGIKEDSSAMLFAMFLYPNGTVTDAHRAQ